MKRISILLLIVSMFSIIIPMTVSADSTSAPPVIWDFGTDIGPETEWFNFHNRGEHTLTDNSIVLTVKAGQTTKPELNIKAHDYSMKDMQWCRIRVKNIQCEEGRIDLFANKSPSGFIGADRASFTIDASKSDYQTYIVNMPKANGQQAGASWLDNNAVVSRLRIDYVPTTTAGDGREIDYIAFFPTYEAAFGWKNEGGSATVIDENGISKTVTLTEASGGETTTEATTTAAQTTTSAQTFDFTYFAIILIAGVFVAMIAVKSIRGKRTLN